MELDEPTAYVDPTGEGVWDFVKGVGKGIVGAVVGAVVVGALVGVATVATPVVAGIAAAGAIGFTFWGGLGFGRTIYEAATGNDASTGLALQPAERHEAAGMVVGGLLGGRAAGLLGGRAAGRSFNFGRRMGETYVPARLRAPVGTRPLGRLTPCRVTPILVGERTIAPATPAAPAIRLRSGTTMAEILEGVPDDAMIHLTRQPSVGPIVRSGGIEYGSSMVRAGEVRGMTLQQFQRDVVGPLAEARASDANTFLIVNRNNPQFGTIRPWPRSNTPLPGTTVQEFRPTTNIMPNDIIEVQPATPR